MLNAGGIYARNLMAAAEDFAYRYLFKDGSSKDEILRKYGLGINYMTSDEISEFDRLIEDNLRQLGRTFHD